MTGDVTVKGEFVCVVCPNGCSIEAEFEKAAPPRLISSAGARCARGAEWVRQEIEAPMRTISSNVLVKGGDCICASVRTRAPIRLDKIKAVMEELKGVTLDAPVTIGQVISANIAGSGTDIIATRNVARTG
jgi:CxxC motif-containing protein